jgi:glycosyltransferase involved in cell wall biosynthesis
MKILHISHTGLPDWRIEKSAITSLNYGYKVFYAGDSPDAKNDSNVFEKIYKIKWPDANYPKKLLIPYILFGKTSVWNDVKKQIKTILEELRPDIVHAHNLVSAKLISEFDIPMIYNDHEYWSIYIKRLYESRIINNTNKILHKKKNLLYKRIIKIWSKWESEIIPKYPTIATSQTTINEMKQKYSKEFFLLPNFPLKTETSASNPPVFHDDLNSVYAGNESAKELKAHRNITGLDNVFNENNIGKLILIGRMNFQPSEKIICKGLLSRKDMYDEMAKCSIGLLPMKKIWSHKYINANKVFEYAHAGLHVISTSSFSDTIDTLQNNCTPFEDYNDLVSKLSYFRDNKDELYKKRIQIFNFAKDNLIWEKYEKNIIEAYQMA